MTEPLLSSLIQTHFLSRGYGSDFQHFQLIPYRVGRYLICFRERMVCIVDNINNYIELFNYHMILADKPNPEISACNPEIFNIIEEHIKRVVGLQW